MWRRQGRGKVGGGSGEVGAVVYMRGCKCECGCSTLSFVVWGAYEGLRIGGGGGGEKVLFGDYSIGLGIKGGFG